MTLNSIRNRLWRPGLRWLAAGAGAAVLTALFWPHASANSAAKVPTTLELVPGDVATVRQEQLDVQLPFNGTLEPLRQILLNARVAGEVTEVAVREGEAVSAGSVLLRQDSHAVSARLEQAEAALQSSDAELETAQEQVASLRSLAQKKFSSRNELTKAETQLAVARAQVEANEAAVAMAQRERENVTLRAPFTGVVAERLVEPGQLVMPNTPLLRVVDLRELELSLQLPSAQLAHVRPGQQVAFTADAYGEEKFTATIVRINPLVRASNRRIEVYALVKNPDLRLRGGLFVRGQLRDSTAASGLVVPVTALQSKDGQPGVMVIRAQRLAWQPVVLGARDDGNGRVIVTQGLKAGERVLAMAVPLRRAGAPVRFAVVASAVRGG